MADLKGEVRAGLEQQRSREAEVNRFLAACGVMQRRISGDVQTLTDLFEQYGYQAPPKTHTQEDAQMEVEEEEQASVEEEEGGDSERRDPLPPHTPLQSAPITTGQIFTPKLADFGLSDLELRRMIHGTHGCPESPPMPVVSLPAPPLPSSLATPLPPTLLLPPKCTLGRTEEEELRVPQLSDFGLSEEELKRMGTACCPEAPPMPVLSLPPRSSSVATPLPPTLLLTPKCALHTWEEEEEEELRVPQMKDFGILEHTLFLNTDFTMDLHRLASRPTNPQKGQPPPQPARPDPAPVMQNLTPEMPKMESMFSSTLLSRSARGVCLSPEDTGVDHRVSSSLEVDDATQDFNLRTPRIKLAYWDAATPEMPDLSSITQDICKLVSRTELKKKQSTSTVPQIPRALGKENRAVLLPLVADSEFQCLPRYLRQMSLSSLNDAIHKINNAAATKRYQGDALQFQAEELESIAGVGIKAPIYFLCLAELHRLEHVQSGGNSAVYKLLPQH